MTEQELIGLVTSYEEEHRKTVLPLQIEGERYYLTKNPHIMNRKREYFSTKQSKAVEDPYKANNKTTSSYVKLLVDQKIGYSVNERMSIAGTESEIKAINSVIDFKRFRKILRRAAKDASNKIYGVIQFVIKDDKTLDFRHIPSEQIVRVANKDDFDVTDAVIRYYQMQVMDSNGKESEVIIAEYWDKDQVHFLMKKPEDDKFYMAPQTLFPENPAAHFSVVSSVNSTVVGRTAKSWGMPPFAFLYNNDEHQRDLDPVLALIKVWDIVTSDFANNLEDFQDVFWILKGYGGQDLDDFFEEVKKYKMVKTDEDGDASTQTIEIPHEAREKMLDRLEKAIYKFGRGVNADDIEGDITNVRIYSLYSGLDLKANEFEMQLNDMFDQCLTLTNQYMSLFSKGALNTAGVDLKFKRAMILNKSEIVDSLTSQGLTLSKRTLLELHPDVNDVDEELKRIAEEEAERRKLLGEDMGFEEDTEVDA